MTDLALHTELRALDRPCGVEVRDLRLGDRVMRLEGLDRALVDRLHRRWGGFLGDAEADDPASTVLFRSGGTGGWLRLERGAEPYRIVAINDDVHRVVLSYHFALCADAAADTWRVAISDDPGEKLERVVENAVRVLAARLAIDRGGFALHAAGILRDDKAYLFAGKSGSGKTTAVGLAAPATSLGDDFAMVLPQDGRSCVPAVPFDNAERIVDEPPPGLFPLAGIWRLRQDSEIRVDRPPQAVGSASLLSCVAFPWLFPESSDRLLQVVEQFVAGGRFAHLHFVRDDPFWTQLVSSVPA